MIASVRGKVATIEDDHVVIESDGGVGYEVFCHVRTLAHLHEQAMPEVTLHIHTSVSDDAIRLYGFVGRQELRFFRHLIAVERIGPRAALSILGRSEISVLVKAIRGGDAGVLATVPGIGRKTAERVVLELKDKLDLLVEPLGVEVMGTLRQPTTVAAAVQALVGLGFREPDARIAVLEVRDGDDADVNDLIGAALRRLDTVNPQ